MNLDKRLLGLLLALGFAASGRAAPFDKTFSFAQPDGTVVEIHGRGDEFHAVFETTEGYAVVFSPGDKSYYYAAQADDGRDLVPSPLRVGQGDPATLGIPKHLRADPVLTRDRAAKRREKWEAGTRTGERWKNRKSALQAATARAAGATSIDAPALEGPALAPPAYETTGTKVGLCLLIDFSDDPATIARTNIVDFCNGDAYAGFGNNGSVKQYYQDVSPNLLEYAWALDPLAASASGKPGGGVLDDYLTLTYRQNKQATDLDFAAEACADLESATWTTNAISEIARADSNAWWQVTERHDVPVSQAPSRFMRLRVEDQQ